MHFHTRIVAIQNQVSAELSGESVVLNLATGIYHGFDEVGSRVWELIQQPTTFGEVRDVLLSEYEVDEATCDQDLRELLEQLQSAHLIEITDA